MNTSTPTDPVDPSTPTNPHDPSIAAVPTLPVVPASVATPQDAPFDPAPQRRSEPASAPASAPVSASVPAALATPLPARLRGPNVELMLVGLLALVAALFGLTRRVLGVEIDWARYSTTALVGVGLLAALIGFVGVIRRR